MPGRREFKGQSSVKTSALTFHQSALLTWPYLLAKELRKYSSVFCFIAGKNAWVINGWTRACLWIILSQVSSRVPGAWWLFVRWINKQAGIHWGCHWKGTKTEAGPPWHSLECVGSWLCAGAISQHKSRWCWEYVYFRTITKIKVTANNGSRVGDYNPVQAEGRGEEGRRMGPPVGEVIRFNVLLLDWGALIQSVLLLPNVPPLHVLHFPPNPPLAPLCLSSCSDDPWSYRR